MSEAGRAADKAGWVLAPRADASGHDRSILQPLLERCVLVKDDRDDVTDDSGPKRIAG